jgi:hypothetical protein
LVRNWIEQTKSTPICGKQKVSPILLNLHTAI